MSKFSWYIILYKLLYQDCPTINLFIKFDLTVCNIKIIESAKRTVKILLFFYFAVVNWN